MRPLDGLTPVERVCADVGRAVRSGRLLPGQRLPLGRLAERHRIRRTTLTLLLGGLERDGLLVVRDDHWTVAPLDIDDLTSMYAVRRNLEGHLLESACAQLTDTGVDRLVDCIPTAVDGLPAPGFGRALRLFHLRLFRPAASAAELSLLHSMLQDSRRYLVLAGRAERYRQRTASPRSTSAAPPMSLAAATTLQLADYRELTGRLRERDVPGAWSSLAALTDRGLQVARWALEAPLDGSPWADLDQIGA